MTTLIAVYSGSGKLVGKCDAHCYDAKGEDCHCVCHGHNHGKGLEKALERNKDQSDQDIQSEVLSKEQERNQKKPTGTPLSFRSRILQQTVFQSRRKHQSQHQKT